MVEWLLIVYVRYIWQALDIEEQAKGKRRKAKRSGSSIMSDLSP
jgi:hypothetical protein